MPRTEPFGVVKLKGILFGDDNWGTVLDEEPPYKNKKGIEMKKYLVMPGEHLMKQYPQLQKPGALSHKNIALWVEYPTYWVSDNNPSRTNAIARIDCGFDGRETSETKRHKHLTDEIKTLREEIDNAIMSNMSLTEENKALLGDKKTLIKDVVEMVTQIRGIKSYEPGESYERREE